MRTFVNAMRYLPPPEERPQDASRRTHGASAADTSASDPLFTSSHGETAVWL
jgi:hypothetical protein